MYKAQIASHLSTDLNTACFGIEVPVDFSASRKFTANHKVLGDATAFLAANGWDTLANLHSNMKIGFKEIQSDCLLHVSVPCVSAMELNGDFHVLRPTAASLQSHPAPADSNIKPFSISPDKELADSPSVAVPPSNAYSMLFLR